VRPDLAGYADVAHAFDLEGSQLAAHAAGGVEIETIGRLLE